MRTRRSPRNQERLFRALFQPPPQPTKTELEIMLGALERAKQHGASKRTLHKLEQAVVWARRRAAFAAARHNRG